MKSMSWRSALSATQIDIDDEALAAAMRLSGAKTKKEMVNIALREYAERRRRTEARLRHLDSAQEWDDDDFWRRHTAEKAGPGADRSEKGVA
jgi:Arc/MetJ family transcription regulator